VLPIVLTDYHELPWAGAMRWFHVRRREQLKTAGLPPVSFLAGRLQRR
jgi:hypothetical protein